MTTSRRRSGETRGRRSRTEIFQRLDAAIDELVNFGGMPTPEESREVWTEIWHLEAHNSTAIEGNTLLLREVRSLLDRGRAVGNKELAEYAEVAGYGRAAKWVYSQARTRSDWSGDGVISLTEIRHIHELVMTQVWQQAPHPDASPSEGPGGYRQHDIHPFSGGMTPPSWVDVPPRMSTWVAAANRFHREAENMSVADRMTRLAELHAEFERIHPFLDGNGRTGRLVLNAITVRLGWPPAIVFKQDRARYLNALDRADRSDAGPLAELLARSIIDNLHRFVVPSIAGPARLVPLESLVSEGISYAALRQAAVRGRLEAGRASDGSWRSSRRAVERYLATKYVRSGITSEASSE